MNHVGGAPLSNDDPNALAFSISDLSICQAFRRYKVVADTYQRTLPYTVKHPTSPYCILRSVTAVPSLPSSALESNPSNLCRHLLSISVRHRIDLSPSSASTLLQSAHPSRYPREKISEASQSFIATTTFTSKSCRQRNQYHRFLFQVTSSFRRPGLDIVPPPWIRSSHTSHSPVTVNQPHGSNPEILQRS